MSFRLLFALVLIFACASPLHAADDIFQEHKKKDKPAVRQDGLLQRVAKAIWPFGKKPDPNATPVPKGAQMQAGKEWKQLVPTILIEPSPLKLADVRTMKVTLQLANHGKKLAQLDFPTTQRIEVLVK